MIEIVDDWNSIKAWRKAKRVELIAAREAFPAQQRQAWSERIAASLEAGVPVSAGAVVGYCWPHRSEFDARFVVRRWRDRGAIAALPEVVDKRGPLQFSRWWPGAPMRAGVYDIPVPDGTGVVEPDIAIVPMNGFDGQGYRLGYGGGYFDRTLAALGRRVIAVGVSFEALRVPTIHPQPHDIPMDIVVTEAGIHRAGGASLVRLSPEECAAELKMLMRGRDLPRPRIPEPREAGSYASPVCYAPEIAPDYFGEAEKKD
jgi:5-formyltetrahydrofolate cyclo-ligase